MKIGAHDCKVYFSDLLSSCDTKGALGTWNTRTKEITVDTCQRADSDIASTLWHEIVHAIDETWGIGLKEQQINCLGEGLAQVSQQLISHQSLFDRLREE